MSMRLIYVLLFIIICALLLTSVYLQFFDHFIPCPLCVLQRLTFAVLGLLFFIGIFLHTKLFGRFVLNVLALVTSSLGIFLAGRQVWLQHFPLSSNVECGVSLQYMMQVLPLNQVLQKVLEGSAECTERGLEFLYLNMAEWSLLWFILFFLLTLYWVLVALKRKNGVCTFRY